MTTPTGPSHTHWQGMGVCPQCPPAGPTRPDGSPIAADDVEWCAGCEHKHSKCECTPTGPDDDRLRAAIARLETCMCSASDLHDRDCPAPQQSPAQEREYPGQWPASGDTTVHARTAMTGPGQFAPPSEADSAGEAVVPTPADWDAAEGCVERACQGNLWTEVIARALADQRAALAASSVVRGGDDQARERLADVLARRTAPLPAEVRCTPWSLTDDADELGEIADELLAVVRAAGGQP